METLKRIVLGIIGALLVAGIIGLAIAFGLFALLIGAGALITVTGAFTIPAAIKSIKKRSERKKSFKSKCKEKKIKPNMKLYKDFQKEGISFGTEVALNTLLSLAKLSTEKKDISVGNTIISKDKQSDYSEFYRNFNDEFITEQLSIQEKFQRTIYSIGVNDVEKYFISLEDAKVEAGKISSIPGLITTDLGLFELYYIGDFEGKSKVVERKSITNPRLSLILTKNGDTKEAYSKFSNEWQEYDNNVDLDKVYSMLASKGIDELVTGIKKRGYK